MQSQHPRSRLVVAALLAIALLAMACADTTTTPSPDVPQVQRNATETLETLKRTLSECSATGDLLKCLKVRALKVAQRAMRAPHVELVSGVDVTQVRNASRQSRALERMDDDQLQALEHDSINGMLYDLGYNFLESHVVSINLPKLVEEARGRKKRNRYAAPFMAALALKGLIMTMTYKSIAVMAGTALIIGKMALVLAAILGLKKLVSGEKEKTTVEIVKHPSHSSSHSHSSSFEDDGHYRRSIPTDEQMMILDNINRDSYLN